jgi:predicted  nucleic acid-binding Zn-ribbon protein
LLEQLRCLIKYQILQDKKAKLLRRAGEIPKRIAELQGDYDQYEAIYLSKKAEHDDAFQSHKSLEQNVADLQARITRSKNRQKDVKTNKEYQAIMKEIEETKKEISGKEESMLELMEKIETLGKDIGELEKELADRKTKIDAEKQQLLSADAEFQGELQELELRQKKIRDQMPADLIKRSDFLIARQAGIAVASVQNGVCQVCRMNIPPQKFIEVQRDENLHECPHCHRFLYWPGHEGYCNLDDEQDLA